MTKVVTSMLLASLLAFVPGCLAPSRGVYGYSYRVESEPPPARHVVVEQRRGYVYSEGNWHWNGRRWAWVDGSYQTERHGNVYIQGRWVRDGRRWQWNPGHWRAM